MTNTSFASSSSCENEKIIIKENKPKTVDIDDITKIPSDVILKEDSKKNKPSDKIKDNTQVDNTDFVFEKQEEQENNEDIFQRQKLDNKSLIYLNTIEDRSKFINFLNATLK
ncbi:MAG: hypothetical protein Q4B52_04695 [Tissierellia bacterium]|nr:hypothetical protein [Tissierellia bacterium]